MWVVVGLVASYDDRMRRHRKALLLQWAQLKMRKKKKKKARKKKSRQEQNCHHLQQLPFQDPHKTRPALAVVLVVLAAAAAVALTGERRARLRTPQLVSPKWACAAKAR